LVPPQRYRPLGSNLVKVGRSRPAGGDEEIPHRPRSCRRPPEKTVDFAFLGPWPSTGLVALEPLGVVRGVVRGVARGGSGAVPSAWHVHRPSPVLCLPSRGNADSRLAHSHASDRLRPTVALSEDADPELPCSTHRAMTWGSIIRISAADLHAVPALSISMAARSALYRVGHAPTSSSAAEGLCGRAGAAMRLLHQRLDRDGRGIPS